MAAGVFPWKFYESTEQTPKDNYQMGIWDGNYFDKTNCPIGLQTTPKGTYCQRKRLGSTGRGGVGGKEVEHGLCYGRQ